MDYAAALRAAPSGPAVRLDTTPAAKAPVQKAPTPKPVKVEIEEPVHVVEEETAPTITLASVPAKPPTNRGLSPIVKFVVSIPPASTAAKDAPSSDANAADSDSSSEDGDAEATDEANANGAKSSKAASSEPKNHIYSAQDLENVRFLSEVFVCTFISHCWLERSPLRPLIRISSGRSITSPFLRP